MREVWPHDVFHLDFDTILEEGKRQEQIDPSNRGEYDLVESIHTYFSGEIMPLIAQDDSVFQSASILVADYVDAYFQILRLCSKEASETQGALHKLKHEVRDFLHRHPSKALLGKTVNLTKVSDFMTLVELEKLDEQTQVEANRLFERAKDHETGQLTVTLRNIRDIYEMGLPRVMLVVRRAMKVKQRIQSSSSDSQLLQPSDYIDWFKNHADSQHPFQRILGNQKLIKFYRVARNVASHRRGLKWEPSTDQVILKDDAATLSVHMREFQQRYRYLVYLCDYGLRGIFSAFCERERGALSDRLLDEYSKTFPKDFPAGEQAKVRYYTR